MGNLLSGLEDLGLGDLKDMEVYEDPTKKAKEAAKAEVKPEEKKEKTEEEYLFLKLFICPVCDHEIRVPAVRTGKAKLVGSDTDLRPHYQGVDPLKYDAIVCPHCGYAAVTRFFPNMTNPQAKLIRTHITPKFQAPAMPEGKFSYDDAILRHRLALVSAMVKRSKISERAYVCLKTAWLIRSKGEQLESQEEKALLEVQELEFLATAFEGFVEAMSKEPFPICGMDETTISLMLAEIGRRIGKYDDASRFVSRIIMSRTATERIKSRAREIKDALLEDMKKAEENKPEG